MIEFGKTLRTAREAKGYTISQLAESTRMIHQTIEDLENENFTRIAAPIYGRGFVKLYCEAVGIDPKPMIAEFMEIFNGNRIPGIKERTPAAPVSAEEPAPAQERKPPAETVYAEPPPVQSRLFSRETTREEPDQGPRQQSFRLPEADGGEKPVTAPGTVDSRLSRYASPLREASLPSIPPTVWRVGALAFAVVLLLWLLGAGVRALYKATSGADADAVGNVAVETPPPASGGNTVSAAAPAQRGKVDVPSLYVD